MTIGLIGLGLMGRALAERLLAAGYEVAGFDISAAACGEALAHGVTVCPDAGAVVTRTNTIILSLPSSVERRDLLWGDYDLAATLPSGTLILDTTTGRPEDTVADAMRLAGIGVQLVDVCLSGSSQVVADGRALALVGDSENGAAYRDILAAISAKQYFFNGPGAGNRVKLIVNTVFGLHRLVLAEALGLARAGGFDLDVILDVLRSGETYSSAMDTKGHKMVSGVYEPAVARLAQHAKDVHLIVEYGERLGAAVPVSTLHRAIIDAVVESGFGDLDNAAIFKAFEREQNG